MSYEPETAVHRTRNGASRQLNGNFGIWTFEVGHQKVLVEAHAADRSKVGDFKLTYAPEGVSIEVDEAFDLQRKLILSSA